MKTIVLAHIIALLLYGCGLVTKRDEIRDFIPGTYIRFSQHEFGTEYDTLVISQVDGDDYDIIRRWKYERVLDGNKIDPEYKRSYSTAVYYPGHNVLHENESGDVYFIDVKQQVLINGNVKYQKL